MTATTACAAAATLAAGQDTGQRADDDFTADSTLDFTVASSAGTQTWLLQQSVGGALQAPTTVGTTTLASAGTAAQTIPIAVGLWRVVVQHPDGTRSAGRWVEVYDASTPGAPASIDLANTPQQTAVGTAFALPLLASVFDARGTPVPGAAVTFAAADPGSDDANPSARFAGEREVTVLADGDGVAVSPVPVANARAGLHRVGVRAGTVVVDPAYRLTNLAGVPSRLARVRPERLAVTLGQFGGASVRVSDAFGNPTPGTVQFAGPASGPGIILRRPNSGVMGRTVTVTAGADGLASTTGETVDGYGAYTVVASLGDASVPFALYNRSATPASVVPLTPTLVDGLAPSTAVPVAPRVMVLDVGGEPVQSQPVVFAVTLGDGSVVDAIAVTDADGEAQVGSWALGPDAAIENRLTADAGGVTTVFVAYARPLFADGFE